MARLRAVANVKPPPTFVSLTNLCTRFLFRSWMWIRKMQMATDNLTCSLPYCHGKAWKHQYCWPSMKKSACNGASLFRLWQIEPLCMQSDTHAVASMHKFMLTPSIPYCCGMSLAFLFDFPHLCFAFTGWVISHICCRLHNSACFGYKWSFNLSCHINIILAVVILSVHTCSAGLCSFLLHPLGWLSSWYMLTDCLLHPHAVTWCSLFGLTTWAHRKQCFLTYF